MGKEISEIEGVGVRERFLNPCYDTVVDSLFMAIEKRYIQTNVI